MTKPIIRACENVTCVIQWVKSIFDKVTTWPQLISEFLVAPALFAMLLLIGLALFILQVFLFSIYTILGQSVHAIIHSCWFFAIS